MNDVLKEVEDTLKEEIDAAIHPDDSTRYPMDYAAGLIQAYRIVSWAQGKNHADDEEIEAWVEKNGWLKRAAEHHRRQKDIDNLLTALDSAIEITKKADLQGSDYMQGVYNALEFLNAAYQKRMPQWYPLHAVPPQEDE